MIIRITALFFSVFILISCQPNHNDTSFNNPDVTINGVIYCQDKDGNLSAFDIAAEKVLWTGPYIHNDNNNTVYEKGIIYISTAGSLQAIDAATGNRKWLFRSGLTGSGTTILDFTRPVVKDSLIYAILASGFAPSIYCLKASTGEKVWNRLIVGDQNIEYSYGTPVISGDKVVGLAHETIGYGNVIMCCDRFTGALKWYDKSIGGYLFNYPFSPDSTQVVFLGSYNVEGLISKDMNDGHVLWKKQAIANSVNNVLPYQHKLVTLFGYHMTQVASFDFQRQVMSPVINDTMWRATACADTIYSFGYDFTMQCRKAGVSTPIWKRDMPDKKIWDSASVVLTGQYNPSYFSTPISDNNILCYYATIRNGPTPILNSLYFLDAKTGNLLKEIKFNDTFPVLGKNMVIVKDSVAYYPMLAWRY